MPWKLLAIETDASRAEILSDAMLESGALSAEICDAAAGTKQEQALFGEPDEPENRMWHTSKLTVMFDIDADIHSIVQAAALTARLPDIPSYCVTHVEEQDWVRATQSQFNPIQISHRLWVVPTWHEPPDPDAINLILDPGQAFGTGTHPSTQLCLRWLDENLREGEDVLDYGCGSGILAIAAVKLGARSVIGVDIDPRAVETSRQNAILNQCLQTKVKFHTPSVTGEGGGEIIPRMNVIVANILANPLILLAPVLHRAVCPGGRIALSGILEEQAEEVIEAYRPGFNMRVAHNLEEWVLLTGTRE